MPSVVTISFQTAPPRRDIPTIISRLLDLDYEHKICTQVFPTLRIFNAASPKMISHLGFPSWQIFHRPTLTQHHSCERSRRLWHCRGQTGYHRRRKFETLLASLHSLTEHSRTYHAVDPWRPDTPHSQYYAKDRPDTTLRPFKLIPGLSFIIHTAMRCFLHPLHVPM